MVELENNDVKRAPILKQLIRLISTITFGRPAISDRKFVSISLQRSSGGFQLSLNVDDSVKERDFFHKMKNR